MQLGILFGHVQVLDIFQTLRVKRRRHFDKDLKTVENYTILLNRVQGVEQSLVQIFCCGGSGGAGPASPGRVITVCLGMGPASKSEAARCALTYIRTMSRPAQQQ